MAAGTFWTLTLNINKLGARQISLDPSTVAAGGDHNADADTLRTAITNAVRGLGTSAAYQLFACTYDTATNRFALTVPQSDSNAMLEVYGGTLASVLRVDTDDVAQLTGSAVANAATHFSAGFAALTTDADRTLTLNVDNRGDIAITLAPGDVTLLGVSNTTDGDVLARAVQDAIQDYDPRVEAYKNLTCTYAGLQFTLTSGSNSPRQSGLTISNSGLATLMGLSDTSTPTLGRDLDQGSAQVIPIQNLGPLDAGVSLADGAEFAPTANTYADFYNQTLRKVRDVSIIVLPGQTWADDGSGNAAISQTLAFAATYQRMMVIVDPPEGFELDQSATVNGLGLPTSTYSVLYYPWVQMANPLFNVDTNPTAPRFVPVAPSAIAAGMWAKIDGKRGVWKAPAGVETQLLGASGLQFNVEDGEQDQLNPLGVNCIRKLPGFGSVFWGSRTLATQADPEWRYVPVRRTAIFIEQSIYNGIQWAVFEPNDHPLWSALRGNIGAL